MKKGWVKILSSDKLYRIEIAKDLLEDDGIESVIVNQKDSLYLFGEIDLYVKKENYDKAVIIVKNFKE